MLNTSTSFDVGTHTHCPEDARESLPDDEFDEPLEMGRSRFRGDLQLVDEAFNAMSKPLIQVVQVVQSRVVDSEAPRFPLYPARRR